MENKLTGLTEEEARKQAGISGKNILFAPPPHSLLRRILVLLSEPMVLILLLGVVLYFILNQPHEAITLLIAFVLVISISIYQDRKGQIALNQLRKLSEPAVKVFRDNTWKEIPAEDIVPRDLILVEEGQTIPADGKMVEGHDFSVNEAILTGESVSLDKWKNDAVMAGCQVSSGSATLQVVAIGAMTEMGKLGKSMVEEEIEKSPLQLEINGFVKKMGLAGGLAFLLVLGIQFKSSGEFAQALLMALTMAMALVPEEIPVAFSSFMALGAVKMSKAGVLVKNALTVESLGAASVICFDKTGTLTTDSMVLSEVYVPGIAASSGERAALLELAMLASEEKPFDAMEKAIFKAWQEEKKTGPSPYRISHEYPLAGSPPMMTHVHQTHGNGYIAAAKGAVEKIISVCTLQAPLQAEIEEKARQMAGNGMRVLAIASADAHKGAFPENQEDFPWRFEGLIGLENPPKENTREVLEQFKQAGIQVKMITGDHVATAAAIAGKTGFSDAAQVLTGSEIRNMGDDELREAVGRVSVFARMFPDAKLKVIKALQARGEVVAMTGDGVNDGPALKAAHIGVSMGKKGTDIARQAASLVLTEDNLESMITALKLGRTIYTNLKKAISYIVSIHIPIVLSVAIPLIFNWKWAQVLFPVHIIFLELVMGPTCSIAFENEPPEKNILLRPPRKAGASLFSPEEIWYSILLGLSITLAVFLVVFYSRENGAEAGKTRTLIFITLVLSNIFLTLSHRSFYESVFQMFKVKNHLLWIMLSATLALLLVTLFVPRVKTWFGFGTLSWLEFLLCFGLSLAGTWWTEGIKWYRRKSSFKSEITA
jgi:Ca2+-transporting ATPase